MCRGYIIGCFNGLDDLLIFLAVVCLQLMPCGLDTVAIEVTNHNTLTVVKKVLYKSWLFMSLMWLV